MRSGLPERTGARHEYETVTPHARDEAFSHAKRLPRRRTGARHGYVTVTPVCLKAEVPRYDHALDFIGALADLQDLLVPVEP